MSGVYVDNVLGMPIAWVGDEGEELFGRIYAVEGDVRVGFIFLVVTKDNKVVQVSVADDSVYLDEEALKAAEEKRKSQVFISPKGKGDGLR